MTPMNRVLETLKKLESEYSNNDNTIYTIEYFVRIFVYHEPSPSSDD